MQVTDPGLSLLRGKAFVRHDRLHFGQFLGDLLFQQANHLEDLLDIVRQAAFFDVAVRRFTGFGNLLQGSSGNSYGDAFYSFALLGVGEVLVCCSALPLVDSISGCKVLLPLVIPPMTGMIMLLEMDPILVHRPRTQEIYGSEPLPCALA